MARDKIVFASDTHMGAGADVDWLGADGRRDLVRFLGQLAADPGLGEVVLVGDTLDCWVWPRLDSAPPSFTDILERADNAPIVAALRNLEASGVRLTIIQGNHDMDSWDDLEPALAGALPGAVYDPVGVVRGGLWAEHGSLHTLFNAPDWKNDPVRGIPLGYYITRVHESRGDKSDGVRGISALLRDALAKHPLAAVRSFSASPAIFAQGSSDALRQGFVADHLAEWFFRLVMAQAGVGEGAVIVLPGGESKKLGDVAAQYADLYADKERELGSDGAWKSLLAEIDIMQPMAERTARAVEKPAVLFGHSHDDHCDADGHGASRTVYLNDGCFLSAAEEKRRHFVALAPRNGGQTATVNRWRSDGASEEVSRIDF